MNKIIYSKIEAKNWLNEVYIEESQTEFDESTNEITILIVYENGRFFQVELLNGEIVCDRNTKICTFPEVRPVEVKTIEWERVK